jgi:hypothetical protein
MDGALLASYLVIGLSPRCVCSQRYGVCCLMAAAWELSMAQ